MNYQPPLSAAPEPARPAELLGESVHDSTSLRQSPILEPFRDFLFGIGLIALLLSSGAFLLYDLLGDRRQGNDSSFTLFMFHYGITVAYSLALLSNGHWRSKRYPERRPARWLGLLLWLLSAYALNRDLAVFQQSTEWLCWALVLVGAAMVAYAWKESLPIRLQQLLYLALGIGCWLFIYMAVYIVELYPISVPALIGLGMSAHTFVPLVFAVVLCKRIWFDAKSDEHLRPGIAVGLTIPLLAIGVFMTGWMNDVNKMQSVRMEATTRQTSDLPEWALIAQRIKPNWITNRLLLAGRVYDQGHFFDGDGWGLSHLTALEDVREHDPLVVIASRIFPATTLPAAEQLNLLKVLHNERHGTEEKFWTGRHLTTEDVVSQVRIWPQFRVSYTEKTLRIRNQVRQPEEALFTFHLPSGSVVSSMSLWVNGREEPARLTTVAKADSAYRQVVNVESKVRARDPSVVYWQEGSRITVRVFPCQASEDRRVKIGITSPLRLEGSQLVYENPYFDGPNASAANELIKVDFATAPNNLQSPWLLDGLDGTTLTHRDHYNPDWSLRFEAPPLSNESFVLEGKAYRLEPYKPVQDTFKPTDVFLDVNAAWTKDEFRAALRATSQLNGRAWIFDDGLKQVSAQNASDTYERLVKQQFSLFPVYRITNPATSLLITKGTPVSPTLSDLKHSAFADRMHLTATQHQPLNTFCFGNELSPYLKTLAELRVLNVLNGTGDDLAAHIVNQHQFPHQLNDSARVMLFEARVTICETPMPVHPDKAIEKAGIIHPSNAPDHLARLFAYNHLLQQIGRNYLTEGYQTTQLIQEAQQANVVSPLSSLVVLETEEDYDRFGIQKDKQGLSNATLKAEGAVPEPHEWALLIMVTLLIGWLYWRKRYALH
ncbi:XrtN system VIT domain-containing protein [Spirosoma soli]|uniref:XrtN system VIT domain-containing protein n=1 Tax=Spirosoma soli TaxID=1770529 RepID=A0ABW5M139_9BACT